MSRHKLVKNLDLDEELDDYDGDEYGYDEAGEGGGLEELSEEDQENMREGTIKVREALPTGTALDSITDKEIQEALWHYYYDVGKSVTYLLNTYSKAAKKAEPKKKKGRSSYLIASGVMFSQAGEGALGSLADLEDLAREDDDSMVQHCSKSFNFAEFFKDTPWFNVPIERQAVLIPPLYPRGGLLGGSSDGAPKMSKLQALAAARRKKAQEQKSESISEVDKPMASLSLGPSTGKAHDTSLDREHSQSAVEQKPVSRGFPLRKRKNSNPHEKAPKAPPIEVEPTQEREEMDLDQAQNDQASPSAFASTMFGSATTSHRKPENIFTMPYTATIVATSPTDAFAGPSPDDVVLAAQSKASKKGGKDSSKTPKTNGEKKADQIASGVEAMKLDDTPRAKSKNLDVLAEYEKAKTKNAANFVVIGHVDAGKSTLMGRLLYDLNVVDERTVERYRKDSEKLGKSSFALAWVLDQGTEERARGVTIDIAMNKFETEKTAFTILDAPGHRDFIPNMIAGASQADFAVLVIDASTGSFESGLKGQTKEHALLVRSMGVQRIIIAVNKLDTVSWSKDRFDEISQQVSAFLIQAGFQQKNISFVPCSGLQGDNIARKSTEPAGLWYTGRTLVEELDNSEPITRALTKPLRLTIDNIFRGGIQNPLSISGRIEAGSLQTGDALLAQPAKEKCFIKGLEVDQEPADWAVAGQNVTVHLSDIDPIHLRVGDVLCSPSAPINSIKHFTAKVLAFEFLMPMQIDVHRGRMHVAGRIKEIVAVLDKSTGAIQKKKPKIVKPGTVARVVVELDHAVPLEAPSRVVLRSNGDTVAAGLLE
ncbi:hypothetical protein BP5796_03903 [Coleophoma crateriformis]|uniref:Elongation factor 1 alpha-like protein n=1 Tax=Coleophoma crateriformis TaxID=565419 RepID=A0A3D8SIG3_9HELO|nr:hypothetical protein BP5796_03903 [Coleophoma crateriformis]